MTTPVLRHVVRFLNTLDGRDQSAKVGSWDVPAIQSEPTRDFTIVLCQPVLAIWIACCDVLHRAEQRRLCAFQEVPGGVGDWEVDLM